MKVWIIGGLAFAAGMAACSNQVSITAENASGTQGAGGAGSSGVGSGSGSGASSSTGTGGPGPGLTKVVTADTDIGQAVSITTTSSAPSATETKLIDGPFFLTDAIWYNNNGLSIVQGGDCSVPVDKHLFVQLGSVNSNQIYGIRLPILAGQSLCAVTAADAQVSVFGFKPY